MTPPAGVHHTRMMPGGIANVRKTPRKMESEPTPDTCQQGEGQRSGANIKISLSRDHEPAP